MVTRDVAGAILDEAKKTGKSISAIAKEMGYKPHAAHNAIFRLRKESSTASSDIDKNPIREIDNILAEAQTRRQKFLPPVSDEELIRPKSISDFARDLQKALAKEAAEKPELSFAFGYASSLIGLARDKIVKQ